MRTICKTYRQKIQNISAPGGEHIGRKWPGCRHLVFGRSGGEGEGVEDFDDSVPSIDEFIISVATYCFIG